MVDIDPFLVLRSECDQRISRAPPLRVTHNLGHRLGTISYPTAGRTPFKGQTPPQAFPLLGPRKKVDPRRMDREGGEMAMTSRGEPSYFVLRMDDIEKVNRRRGEHPEKTTLRKKLYSRGGLCQVQGQNVLPPGGEAEKRQ